MNTRLEARAACAEALNRLSKEQLLERFGISRLAYLSGLDCTGLPIYSSVRPLSKTIAIHCGKSFNRDWARAGAIAEAIEFEVAEHPTGPFRVANALQLPEEERVPLEDCFPVRANVLNELTLIAWEEATNIQNGAPKLIPSDLVWMTPRIKEQPLMHFQMSSNGLASGADLEDAILSGLYEIIERDGWTLNLHLMDLGVLPKRVPLVNLPEPLAALVARLEHRELKLHVFDCTTDYSVPVFNATILDLSGRCSGTFAGYGAHLDAETALARAVCEAIQGRVCYLSGARDDLLRRQFLLMKRLDQEKMDKMFGQLNLGGSITEYRKIVFPDVKTELRYLLKLLKSRGVSDVFVKDMGGHGPLHVVRVFSPQCEPHRFDHWAPTLRCTSYAQRILSAELTSDQEQEDTKWAT
jgi:ribosomal protein S12 methylthiotransferase accessory factor